MSLLPATPPFVLPAGTLLHRVQLAKPLAASVVIGSVVLPPIGLRGAPLLRAGAGLHRAVHAALGGAQLPLVP